MRIKILSSAVDDLHAGRLFYEMQGEGLGEYFFDSLFSDIDALALYAGIHPKVLGYHRLLSKPFPYAVYYTRALHQQAALAAAVPAEHLPNAERCCAEVLAIPVYPGLTEAERNRVIEVVTQTLPC